ncbi:MAG: hypothetical protein RL417_1097 [Pseudomonadota bacterium]
MSFFKKKSEDSTTKPSAPFEVDPKAINEPPRSTTPTSESFTARVSAAAPPAATPPTAETGFDRFGKLRSALGPGTVIQGKLSFDTPVRIDGKLSGEIFSSQAIIVGAGGSVEGEIEVASLIVLGVVKGNVLAHERIEVLQGGRLEADFSAPVFTMEDGGSFNGRASMVKSLERGAKSGSGLNLEVSKESSPDTVVTSAGTSLSGTVARAL